MIKLGWSTRAPEPSGYVDQIEFARELGLDITDFHLQGIPNDPAFLLGLKMHCLKAGLPIGYLGAGSLAGPAEQKDERLAKAKADVDIASFLGAQLVRVFARGKWPEDTVEQEAVWGPLIESFQELCDYSAEKGVVLGLQNHNHGSCAMNADLVLRILSDTNRDNLTFIMDTGQWQGSPGTGSPRGWMDITVDIYKDYIERTAQFASAVRAKIYKIDNGREEWLDYPRIFKILHAAGFNGNVSICFEGGAPPRNRCDTEECIKLASHHLREVIAEVYG